MNLDAEANTKVQFINPCKIPNAFMLYLAWARRPSAVASARWPCPGPESGMNATRVIWRRREGKRIFLITDYTHLGLCERCYFVVWRESLQGVAQRALPAREGPQRQRARRGQPLQLKDRFGLFPGRRTGLRNSSSEAFKLRRTHLNTENTRAIFPIALILFLMTSLRSFA